MPVVQPVYALLLMVALFGILVLLGARIAAVGIRLSRWREPDADRLLRARLARGEITPTEYDEVRRVLDLALHQSTPTDRGR
jgi:uncharacterized membrane protein